MTGFLANLLQISFVLFSGISILSYAGDGAGVGNVGICYGQLGDNLPTPSKSVELLKSMNVKHVKIYDSNPAILTALIESDMEVTVMVPNQLLVSISTDESVADEWIRSQVLPFYPKTMIRYVLVGNEILSSPDRNTQLSLVPSMNRIQNSLAKFGLADKIRVSTSLAMDILESSYPPSNGAFRADMSTEIIKPLLQFLMDTKSFLFFDIYTYFAWASNPVDIKLEYALLSANNIMVTDPGTGLTYTNLLDQMLDSVYFAMKRMGYPNIPIFLAETGWPNGGDVGQTEATINNAAIYNQNVINKFTAVPAIGTPAQPGVVIPALIFALYNENLKTGQGSERFFGVLYPNGSSVYGLDLAGKKGGFLPPSTPPATPEPPTTPPATPAPPNNEGKVWCVVRDDEKGNYIALRDAMDYACGQGNGTCDPIKPQGVCYPPDSFVLQVGYAFSAYWAQFKNLGGSCDFNGLAQQTTNDPSYGSCIFPSVTP